MIDRYRTTQGRHARRLDGGPEGGWDLPADVGKEGITILANIAVNPRARTGRDRRRSRMRRTSRSLNPRARTGRDIDWTRNLENFWLFQSTRPHGARLQHWAGVLFL